MDGFCDVEFRVVVNVLDVFKVVGRVGDGGVEGGRGVVVWVCK